MPAAKPSKADVLELEKTYWNAMEAKDGKKAAALSGETSIVTGARGVMSIPKAKMGAMTESGDWELISYDLEDVEVAVPSPDVAIIAYQVRQKVRMKGEEQELHAADSSTWVRGENGWECHAHSETFLTPEKEEAPA